MFTQRLQGMGDAALMAMKQLSQIVHRQAVVMGYGDAFFMLTLFYFGLSLLVMLLKKPAILPSGIGAIAIVGPGNPAATDCPARRSLR